jgi:hypothetical protein
MGVRFACALIMHLTNLQEVATGLQMIKWLRRTDQEVYNSDMCYNVALMKLTSTLAAEFAMIFVICSED